MTASPDKVHLTFGGSSAQRWLRCAGSTSLIATLPPQVENEYMAQGTRAHSLLELALKERRDTVLDFEGETLPGYQIPYTKEDVEAVQYALDYVNDILERSPDAILNVELFVTLAEDIGGTVDVLIYEPATGVLHVIDYKHGAGKFVSAYDEQFKFYGTCAVMKFDGPAPTRINATVIQPRCFGSEPVRTAVYSTVDLMEFSDQIEAAVAAAQAPDAPFTPGEGQCKWCPAASVCPALNGHVQFIANDALAAMYHEPETDTVITLPSAERMRLNPVALFETLALLPTLQAWLDAVGAEAVALGMAGVPTPGFKFVPKRAVRKWADEDTAREWFAGIPKFTQDDFAPRKLLSVAQAEKVVKAKLGKEGVTAMAAHVNKESSGYNLVPLSAPGEAVSPQALAAAAFATAIPLENE